MKSTEKLMRTGLQFRHHSGAHPCIGFFALVIFVAALTTSLMAR